MENSDSILRSLKQKLGTIVDALDRRKRIIFIDYPLYRNIGDQLINAGTEKFFDDSGLVVKRRYNLYDLPARIPDVDDNDMFVFHGAGNFGDLYPEHLDALTSVIEQFPRHQVLQFPQTTFFSSDQAKEQRAALLRKHQNLTIFVRDSRSLTSLQDVRIPNVYLMPDMAHQLYGQLVPYPKVAPEENLYFFRTDSEGGNLPSTIAMNKDRSVDWDDCIDLSDRMTCALLIRTVKFTRALGHAADVHRIWYRNRDNMIQSGIRLLSKGRVVNTNRLHAMILGLLIGRDVHWFDNTYGKLSSYVDVWIKDMPTLKRIE